MKIYLAAKYSRQEEMRLYRYQLQKFGHVVTSRWINGDHDDVDPVQCAKDDYDDLSHAEMVISFTEKPRKPNSSRGGRHVEFGLGLALGKRLIVVGFRENVFHHLPVVEFFSDWDSALKHLS